jgi:hypothetical protein
MGQRPGFRFPPISVAALKGRDRCSLIPQSTQQEAHHRVVSFQEEFQKLLDAHGIAYDERYVGD